ncbi:hypothetical protein [Marinomonas sp.]|uniref:hypothetical protein n=1 Tax=Marinomonas sp. TaxID=1904862 RepID=UPI003BA96432
MPKIIDRNMKEEANKLLYSNFPAGLIIIIITSAVLAFGFEKTIDQSEKVVWWLIMLGIVFYRAVVSAYYKKNPSNDPKRNLFWFSIGATATAFMWSFYTLYFYHNASEIELTATMVIVAGFASGSAMILSANRTLSLSYILILLLPYSVLLMSSEVSSHQTLGFLGLFFTCIILLSAFKTAGFTVDVISTKHQHAKLLVEMEQKVEERTQAFITLSNIDSLTNLLNRKALIEQLDKLMNSKSEHAYSADSGHWYRFNPDTFFPSFSQFLVLLHVSGLRQFSHRFSS